MQVEEIAFILSQKAINFLRKFKSKDRAVRVSFREI